LEIEALLLKELDLLIDLLIDADLLVLAEALGLCVDEMLGDLV